MTKSNLPAGRRELSPSHIRFYRAVMESVDARRAWDFYMFLDGDFSEPLCTATLGWVRQVLIGEALASNQPGLIGLFRRDPRQIKTGTGMTLDEYASRLEDAGAWSEDDIRSMWLEEFGDVSKAELRRDRLGKRLREALNLLEKATRRRPLASDLVAQWLAPHLAQRLNESGYETLGSVRTALDARKTPRWKEVPGVGEVWADRLREWMDESGILPSALPSPFETKRASVLVPLERFETPLVPFQSASYVLPSVTQTHWPYPDNNDLGARDDKHAIEIWLDAKASNPNTKRSYRKNAERLLLWCHLERRSTFPELKVEDCIHYRTWLNDLGKKKPEDWAAAGWKIPAEDWIGKRAAKRESSEWRPFDGPLSNNSVVQDLLTVRSLFQFLKLGLVLKTNPWDLLGNKARTRATLEDATEQFVSRSLSMDQWKILVDGLSVDGPELERRLLLILWLGVACGLRAAEMLSLTLGSLIPSEDKWRMRVLGKGNKVRNVPLPHPVLNALLRYLDSVGLPYDRVIKIAVDSESEDAIAPILRGQRGRRSLTRPAPLEPLHYTQLYNILKRHLAMKADELNKSDPVAAAKFKKASTHWLRHTCATLALKNGVPLPGVQLLLGHSSLVVTSKYVTDDADALQDAMEKFAARAQQ